MWQQSTVWQIKIVLDAKEWLLIVHRTEKDPAVGERVTVGTMEEEHTHTPFPP